MAGGADTGVARPDDPIGALRAAGAAGVLPFGARLLVACSGGCDSLALVHALRAVDRWPLAVATVDHGLRAESRAHADHVLRTAEAWGIAAVRLSADPAAVRAGAGPEAAARRERYRLLYAHAREVGAGRLVTAHTADDQAETVLMRIGQGTGLRGLAGIPPLRGIVARPWLAVPRAAVRAYAEAAELVWQEDPSNADPRYLRNALRHAVSPGLRETLGPGWTVRAARSAAHARRALALVDWLLERTPGPLVEAPDGLSLDLGALESMPRPARAALIAHAVGRAADRWTPGAARRAAAHVERLADLPAGPRHALPGGLEARRRDGRLIIGPRPAPAVAPAAITIAGPGRHRWGEWAFEVRPGRRGETSDAACLAARGAPLPWIVRAARPGERYRPRGAPGHKSVFRLWADRGVERERRPALPVIEAGGALVWAAGLRTAERVRAEADEPGWLVRVTGTGDGASDPSGGG